MKCPFCSKEFEQIKTEYNDICIDGLSKNNVEEHINSLIEFCPHCGAISDDFTDFQRNEYKKKEYTEKVLNNPQHQEIIKDKTIGETEKRLLLLKFVKENKLYSINGSQDVNVWLYIYYKHKGFDDVAKIYAENVITECLKEIEFQKKWHSTEKYTDEVITNCIDTIIELIETYRQTANFEKANEYINILNKYKFRRHEKSCKAKTKLLSKLCKKQITDRIESPNVKDSYNEIVF